MVPKLSWDSIFGTHKCLSPKMVPKLSLYLPKWYPGYFSVKIEGKLVKLDTCHSIGNTTQGQNSLFAHHLSQPPLSLSLISVGAAVNYLQWPQNVYQHEEHNLRLKLYNYIKVRFKVYCEILMPEVQKPKSKTASVLLVWLSILKTKGTTRLLGSRASKPTRFGGRKWPEKNLEFSSFSGRQVFRRVGLQDLVRLACLEPLKPLVEAVTCFCGRRWVVLMAGEGEEREVARGRRERNFFFFTVPNFPSILTENLTEVPFRTNGC